MIIVMGAKGNTGKKIVEKLLIAGESVRALARTESKLAELQNAGADVLAGDANDAAFLTTAFRGADAGYTLLPTDPSSPDYRAAQDRLGEARIEVPERNQQNTTPTRFEDFADELARADKAM